LNEIELDILPADVGVPEVDIGVPKADPEPVFLKLLALDV